MGLPFPGLNKNEYALKLLALSDAEAQELLSFLFRKMQYRIGESVIRDGVLWMVLTQQSDAGIVYTLACWTGTKKALDLQFLQSFLKDPPFVLPEGQTFANGFLISPYEFSEDFQDTTKHLGITIFSGKALSELLIQHDLTYNFPTTLEVTGRMLRRYLPFIAIPLVLIYGLFTYLTLTNGSNPRPKPSPSETPSQVAGSIPSSSLVSLVTSSNIVELDRPNEFYKRVELSETVSLVPERKLVPQRVVVSNPHGHLASTPRVHSKNPTKTTPNLTGKTTPSHLVRQYDTKVDLEEKYYGRASALQKHGYSAQAKHWARIYLKRFPEGEYAENAKKMLNK